MANIPASKLLPAGRIAIGGLTWASPDLAGKLFMMKTKDNHEAIALGRLFGVRDVALGVGALASSGDGAKLWWQLGLVCDAADAAAGVLGFKAGGSKLGSVLLTGAAISGVVLGVTAMKEAAAA